MVARSLPVLTAACLAILAGSAAPQAIQMKSVLSTATGDQPRASALCDFDADGDLDLAVLTTAELRMFTNSGGSFAAGQVVDLGQGPDAGRVTAGDLDGDGDVDLAATHRGGWIVLLENAAGVLSVRTTLALQGAPDDVVSGDLDQDGDLDLFTASEFGVVLHALWSQGPYQFTVQRYQVRADATSLAVGRVTGFGALDLVVSSTNSRLIQVFRPAGAGGPALVGLPPVKLDIKPMDIALGDLDGNAFADIVATGYVDGGITFGRGQVLDSDGFGQLQKGPVFPVNPGPGASCALGDFDEDGALDLAVNNVLGDVLTIFQNDGAGSFPPPSTPFLTDYACFDLDVGDLDGDGAADLVASATAFDRLWVLLNAAVGTPCAMASYCTAKTHSLGGKSAIGSSGLPGFGSQGFAITLSGAVPNQIALAIWSDSGAASLPFSNGTLCVQPPLKRFTAQQLSASGSASRAVPISAAMIGAQRWYQWWFRDPAHPDGTGVGLSDGLSVVACP
jgi:hypothetical protein